MRVSGKSVAALVARSLFDAAGAVYERAQHRVSRTARLEASEKRRSAIAEAKNEAMAKAMERLSTTRGAGGKSAANADGAAAASTAGGAAASASEAQQQQQQQQQWEQKDREEVAAAGRLAEAQAAAALTNRDFGYFNDPHVQEPKFLYNARASARTFTGIDLIEEDIPYTEVA
jgi:hypothetical protein